jgi:hypothetical protein
MSLVAHYKLNDPATLTTDSAGSFNLTNLGVGTVTDATYGTVASFAQTTVQEDLTYLHTTTVPAAIGGNSPRTYSSWVRPTASSFGTRIICGQGEVSSASGPEFQLVALDGDQFTVLFSGSRPVGRPVDGTWFHSVVTYDGTTERVFIDGILSRSTDIQYNTHTTGFAIGNHLRYVNLSFRKFGFDGQILDFRIYDDALSAGDITSLYNDGPNPLQLPFTPTPRVTSAVFTVSPVDGATGYRLTYQKTGSNNEVIALNNFTDLDQTIRNLVPETEYTFRLYSTTGTVFTLEAESIATTLANSAGNYDVNDFVGPSGRIDISSLDNNSVGLISDVMNDLFTTDDVIDIKVSGKTRTSKFVNRGGIVNVADSEALIAPFSSDGGSGQAIVMTLSDSSTVTVSYDETTAVVAVGDTTYDNGESLILDGRKVTIVNI